MSNLDDTDKKRNELVQSDEFKEKLDQLLKERIYQNYNLKQTNYDKFLGMNKIQKI